MKKMYAEMLINGICHGAYFVDNFSDWGVTPNYATRFSWPGEDDTEATFDWKDGEGILDIKLKEIEICGAKCNIPPWIDEDSN